MRVLFQSRRNLLKAPGGDTTQMFKTAEHLREIGCEVDISTALELDLHSYDLVHLFNLSSPQDVYPQALNAKRQGKKIVLSTIFMDYAVYEKHGRDGVYGMIGKCLRPSQIEYMKVLARAIKNREYRAGASVVLKNGYNRLQSRIIDMADVLLPNSPNEMSRLTSHFPNASSKKRRVVPNAVDASLFGTMAESIPDHIKEFKDCVLCVARIEGVKNQLNLVRAMKGLPYRLVLIGKPAPNHSEYYERVKEEAGDNVRIIGQLPHEELPMYYQVTKVHVLASWTETTGLSSLEAGAMGCNLVITERGCADTRDYFRDDAFYCDPGSVSSIRQAVVNAFKSQGDERLRSRILANYVWQETAASTALGYKLALGV